MAPDESRRALPVQEKTRPLLRRSGTLDAVLRGMKASEELRERIEERQKRLEAEYHQLKADQGGQNRERMQEIENKLDEMKKNLRDGWDNLSQEAAEKLNQLLR
jgi:archaellum component FlaC